MIAALIICVFVVLPVMITVLIIVVFVVLPVMIFS